MRQFIAPLALAIVAGSGAGYLMALAHKPAPTIVQPQTTVVQRAVTDPKHSHGISRSERRQLSLQWGDLDQKEVDALTALLNKLPKVPVVIFCVEDTQCGDLRDDLENSFESAHWDVKTEKPLIDDTVGLAASSEALRDAINEATSGRLKVGIIKKNAPFEAIALGRKPRDNEPRKTITIEKKT